MRTDIDELHQSDVQGAARRFQHPQRQAGRRPRRERAWLSGAAVVAIAGISAWVSVAQSVANTGGRTTVEGHGSDEHVTCLSQLSGVNATLIALTMDGVLSSDEAHLVRAMGITNAPTCGRELEQMVCAPSNPATLSPVRVDAAVGC